MNAEAIVLRTWPIREADQIVTLFTREFGKLKGVAKSAAKSRRRFGGALEPMTHVRASFVEKPRQDLVRLDYFEIVRSPLSVAVDYTRLSALAFFAEVIDETQPDHDPNDAVFRLLLTVLEAAETGSVWMPVTYFALWITRLMGWLPELQALHAVRRSAGRGACVFSCAVRRAGVRASQAAGFRNVERGVAAAGGADLSCAGWRVAR